METATSKFEGKYLTFLLDEDKYGIEILKVREIIAMVDITPIPNVPDFVQGVINLRGRIIPILDLRIKLGFTAIEYIDHTCIIIVEYNNTNIGIVVDHVSEVIDLKGADLEMAPLVGVKLKGEFILVLGKIDNKIVTILNVDKIISSEEFVLEENV